jgi:hypothetical protein
MSAFDEPSRGLNLGLARGKRKASSYATNSSVTTQIIREFVVRYFEFSRSAPREVAAGLR